MNRSMIVTAWRKLLIAYGLSLACSLAVGSALVFGMGVPAEAVYELSTKRLSYAMPVFDAGVEAGVDGGLLIFAWNALGALITMSFIYTASLLDPAASNAPPKRMRKLFSGPSRMRLLCFLPGCSSIGPEPVRRLYVWLMIPLLSLILLGIESGLSLAAAGQVFGSFWTAAVSMLPHGVVEIPAFCLAGAVTYSAHLVVKEIARTEPSEAVFQKLRAYRDKLPVIRLSLLVVLALLIAGVIEAHVTQLLLTSSI